MVIASSRFHRFLTYFLGNYLAALLHDRKFKKNDSERVPGIIFYSKGKCPSTASCILCCFHLENHPQAVSSLLVLYNNFYDLHCTSISMSYLCLMWSHSFTSAPSADGILLIFFFFALHTSTRDWLTSTALSTSTSLSAFQSNSVATFLWWQGRDSAGSLHQRTLPSPSPPSITKPRPFLTNNPALQTLMEACVGCKALVT